MLAIGLSVVSMFVKDLKANSSFDTIELSVVSKGEARDFTSRYGSSGRVCDVKCEDEMGAAVSLTLWNDEIDKVGVGDKIRISNGWVKEWQGDLQVSTGRRGKLEIL
jgi:replication factor A1